MSAELRRGGSPDTGKAHFHYLDWLRGVAAVLVFIYHARNLFFVDAAENPAPLNLTGKFFYFVSGFGHLSVMVFFVLSGCVIAHAVIPAMVAGTWSWKSYLLARVTRLWVVLVPGLILTFGWDTLAWRFFTTALTHAEPAYAHMLTPADRDALGGITFFGNMAFLQTLEVPTYGSNGALWSLANEFWYYVVFPLIAAAGWGAGGVAARLACLALAVGLVGWAKEIVALFPVWLIGVAVYLLWRRGVAPRGWLKRWGWLMTGGAALAVLSFLRWHAAQGNFWGGDYAAGAAVGLFVFFLLFRMPPAEGFVQRAMQGVSRISFTLYIAHTPILVFLASAVMDKRSNRWPWDAFHFGCFILILATVAGYCYMVYFLTEAQTTRVRKWVGARLGVGA
jgi:peptidoglycan/LPS O-acetylase OafA/YrhL